MQSIPLKKNQQSKCWIGVCAEKQISKSTCFQCKASMFINDSADVGLWAAQKIRTLKIYSKYD